MTFQVSSFFLYQLSSNVSIYLGSLEKVKAKLAEVLPQAVRGSVEVYAWQ